MVHFKTRVAQDFGVFVQLSLTIKLSQRWIFLKCSVLRFSRELRAGCNACQHLLSFIIWPRFERSSNSECIFTLLGSIFELGAQITSAHIHTSTNIHNNSVDYTAHYCRHTAEALSHSLLWAFVTTSSFRSKKLHNIISR